MARSISFHCAIQQHISCPTQDSLIVEKLASDGWTIREVLESIVELFKVDGPSVKLGPFISAINLFLTYLKRPSWLPEHRQANKEFTLQFYRSGHLKPVSDFISVVKKKESALSGDTLFEAQTLIAAWNFIESILRRP